MAVDFASDPLAELTYYQGLAVDGVFVDCPSTAREWKLATGQLSAQPTSWVGAVISGPGKPFLLPRNFTASQTVNLWHECPRCIHPAQYANEFPSCESELPPSWTLVQHGCGSR